jgi:hypothetical protein
MGMQPSSLDVEKNDEVVPQAATPRRFSDAERASLINVKPDIVALHFTSTHT